MQEEEGSQMQCDPSKVPLHTHQGKAEIKTPAPEGSCT